MTHMPPATPDPSRDELWQSFITPPDDARPRAWWHWMDGNIDAGGVERDLRWLHEVGVRGAQIFDGGMGVPLVVPDAVRPGSPAWDEALTAAVDTAAELGMELAVATSAGWSASGAPWVKPQDAMKKLVWSHLVVTGGELVDVTLPPLPSVRGIYQDSARWGAAPTERWATEWRVIAFPADAADDPLRPAAVRSSAPIGDWSCLTDESFNEALELPRDPDAWSSAWIEQEFREPVTVRSVVVGLPGPSGFGAAPAPDATLQASDDGVDYRDVAVLSPTAVPSRTASFAPVTARWFRLVLAGASAADALPPVAAGVRRPPVLRRSDAFTVTEFALRTGGRVHHAETKAGFGVVPDYFDVDTDPAAAATVIAPDAVLDLTDQVSDGRLRWPAPPGRWRILRVGASLTGQTNGPAPADSTGLEVDKLDGEKVSAYLDEHLRRYSPRHGGFDALLSDSIEAGPQNWTDAIAPQFRALRGYDLQRWIPALAGYLVAGADESDRFLYDYRRTLSELLSTQYYATLGAEARQRGMAYYAEALEDGRPQLGDDLAMRAAADVPMGAMWTHAAATGPRPTFIADLKGAVSVAHVYGKRWTGSEAFSSFDAPWQSTPANLKHVADLQLALGVTRFCIHTSPHQPLSTPPPGIALSPFLGQAFTVHETWAGMARPWIDYLARCSALLAAGEPAVEVAVFIGEEAPVTGLFNVEPDTAVPLGFDFDYVGPDALMNVLDVDDEQIVSRGARYRALYLGGSSHRMTIAALRRIDELLDAGATVVGVRPHSSPSLADSPTEFTELCDRIWSDSRTGGRLLDTADLDAAIHTLGMRPHLTIHGPRLRRIARIIGGRRITFVANPSAQPVHVRIETSDGAHALSAWDPVRARSQELARSTTGTSAEPTSFLLDLPAYGSVFLVPETGPVVEKRSQQLDGDWSLHLPGLPPFALGPEPTLWTELGSAARAFSGTGTYSTSFTAPTDPDPLGRVLIDLGEVHGVGRVTVNGHECGIAWTPPFLVDISDAVHPGENHLAIEVAGPWRNRLIAEAQKPSGEIFLPMTKVFEPDAAPVPAGLSGHPVLVSEAGD